MITKGVRDIQFSGIGRFFQLVQRSKSIVSLGIGEPGFPTLVNKIRRSEAGRKRSTLRIIVIGCQLFLIQNGLIKIKGSSRGTHYVLLGD